MGLACVILMNAMCQWQSVNESLHAVLDCFFWRSKTDQLSIADAESFRSPDPRLDHEVVMVSVSGEPITKCLRCRPNAKVGKRTEWLDAVHRSLALSPEYNEFK